MWRFALSVTLLMLLGLSSIGTLSACSVRRVKELHVRCGTKELRLTRDPFEGKIASLDGAFDRLGAACGESPEALERFFVERQDLWADGATTFERHSPPEEQALRAQRDTLRFGECFYQDYERVGNWLKPTTRQRPYCFREPSLSPCGEVKGSLTAFLLHAETSVNPGALKTPLLLMSSLLALTALLACRRHLGVTLRPRLLTVLLAPGVGVWWFYSTVWSFPALSFVLDALFLIAVVYLVASFLIYSLGCLRTLVEGESGDRRWA